MANALTYQEFKNKIATCRDSSYTLLTLEPNDGTRLLSRTPITVQHSCGEVFTTKLQHFVNDNKGGCKRCYLLKQAKRPIARVTVDILKERLSKNSPHLEYVRDFKNTKKKCVFKHKKCGQEFETLPKEIFRYPERLHCSDCSNIEKRGNYILSATYLDDLIKLAPDGDEYEWVGKYNNDNKKLIDIKHLTCETIYQVRPNDFQQGYRCPLCMEGCMPTVSRNVKRITQRLEELGADYKTEYIDSRCKTKDKNGQMRFDFAIQHDDGLLIIEYDGEFHFEENINSDFSRKIITRTIKRDKDKEDFINSHLDEYFPIERITYKDKVIKTLDKILHKYFDF